MNILKIRSYLARKDVNVDVEHEGGDSHLLLRLRPPCELDDDEDDDIVKPFRMNFLNFE